MMHALDEDEPHLLYRGVVTTGQFAVQGPFMVGPAIDCAARWHEQAHGAFVWADPETRDLIGDQSQDLMRNGLVKYSVPLKDQRANATSRSRARTASRWLRPFACFRDTERSYRDTLAIAPFLRDTTAEDRARMLKRARATFARGAGSADVQAKEAETMSFLEFAAMRHSAWRRSLGVTDGV